MLWITQVANRTHLSGISQWNTWTRHRHWVFFSQTSCDQLIVWCLQTFPLSLEHEHSGLQFSCINFLALEDWVSSCPIADLERWSPEWHINSTLWELLLKLLRSARRPFACRAHWLPSQNLRLLLCLWDQKRFPLPSSRHLCSAVPVRIYLGQKHISHSRGGWFIHWRSNIEGQFHNSHPHCLIGDSQPP